MGISHKTAGLDVLARAAGVADDLRGWMHRRTHPTPTLPIAEWALLATCNRVEIYAICQLGYTDLVGQALRHELLNRMVDSSARPYMYEGLEAVRHICRVAGGMESLVLGEHEIAGQVARVLRGGWRVDGSKTGLDRLASAAKASVGRIRTETRLGHRPASVGSAAVDLLGGRCGTLEGRSALIVGAGEAATSVSRALRIAGAERLLIVSRTPARAARLATEVGGETGRMSTLPALLATVDVVVAAATVGRAVVQARTVRASLASRSQRRGPLLLLDLSVPRAVEPAVSALPRVRLLTLEDVGRHIHVTLAARRAHLGKAEDIVRRVVRDFAGDEDERDLERLLAGFRRRAEGMRAHQVSLWLAKRDRHEPPGRDEVDRLTRRIVNKILHPSMTLLRGSAAARCDMMSGPDEVACPPDGRAKGPYDAG